MSLDGELQGPAWPLASTILGSFAYVIFLRQSNITSPKKILQSSVGMLLINGSLSDSKSKLAVLPAIFSLKLHSLTISSLHL